MSIESLKAPVGIAVVITIICILLDYNLVGQGIFTLLTFIPVALTSLLILVLVGFAIYNYFSKD